MIFSIKNVVCIFFALQTFCSATIVHAGRAYFEDRRELALMRCLNHNYKMLGVYKANDLKDYSSWTYKLFIDYKFTLDGSIAMDDFIEKNAGDFYKENLPIKSELSKPPFNAIFARCMAFYKSKGLRNFLLHSNP